MRLIAYPLALLLGLTAHAFAQSSAGSGVSGGGGGGSGSTTITGTLPAFAQTPTFNVGTIAGIATETGVQQVRTALGSPFQAGGSIGNTAFGISGTLPAFASTPTVNLGTVAGLALDATVTARLGTLGQKAMAGSAPVAIASDQGAVPTSMAASIPNNFTMAALGASGTYTGAAYNTNLFANGVNTYAFGYYTCSAFADQAGTLFVESSSDAATFYPRNGTSGTAVAAGANVDVKVPIVTNVTRCRYVNGATAQTKFMLTGTPTRN